MFCIWYFCLAPVHKLLAWEVGLDSLSTFHRLAMYCLCLEFGNVGNWGLVLLGRVWGLLSIECFIVTQMNPNELQHFPLLHHKPCKSVLPA